MTHPSIYLARRTGRVFLIAVGLTSALGCVGAQRDGGGGSAAQATLNQPGRSSNANDDDNRLPDVVEKALWWLPENTESVSIAKGPFNPDASRAGLGLKVQQLADFSELSVAAHVWILHLKGLRELSRRHIEPNKVELTISAQFPLQRNIVPDTLKTPGCCRMIVFSKEVTTRVLEALEPHASKVHKIQGKRILEFRSPEILPSGNSMRVYFARAAPRVLLLATELASLSPVVERIGKRNVSRALPAKLREWKFVDTSARVWGIRHYRRESMLTSSVSMLRRDQAAQGMVYTFDEKGEASVLLRYVSTNRNRDKLLKQVLFDHYELVVTSRKIANDAAEVRLVLDRAGDGIQKNTRPNPDQASSYLGDLLGSGVPLE